MREQPLRAADTAEADTREDAAVLAEVIRSAGAEASADVLEDILSAEEALPAAAITEQADTAVHAREVCTITIMTTDGCIRQARIITIMSTEAAYLADIITTIHTADEEEHGGHEHCSESADHYPTVSRGPADHMAVAP